MLYIYNMKTLSFILNCIGLIINFVLIILITTDKLTNGYLLFYFIFAVIFLLFKEIIGEGFFNKLINKKTP